MTRAVLLVDYFDRVREFSFVKEMAKRVELKIYTEKAASEAETAERLRDAHIVIAFRDRVIYTSSLLAQMEHVQLLAACGARLTHIDLEAATKHGVLITAPPQRGIGSLHEDRNCRADLEPDSRSDERDHDEPPGNARRAVAKESLTWSGR